MSEKVAALTLEEAEAKAAYDSLNQDNRKNFLINLIDSPGTMHFYLARLSMCLQLLFVIAF